MTVIAWDGEVLAADQLIVNDNGVIIAHEKKVFEAVCPVLGKVLFAYAGEVRYKKAFLGWLNSDMNPEKFPKMKDEDQTTFIVISEEIIRIFGTSPHYSEYPANQKMAWGCGKEFAYGAMEAGMSAIGAVDVAIKKNVWCGGAIDFVALQ